MTLLLNILWFIFGGFVAGCLWLFGGLVLACTIVGLPWAFAAWRIAGFVFWPFGKQIVDREHHTGEADLGTGLRGFRVPCLLISPRARRGAIAHEVYDHTSVLKAIEWRWGLEPLSVRDAAARNIAEVLDFESAPRLKAPHYDVPRPLTLGCIDPQHTHAGDDWAQLNAYALTHGFR